MKKLFNKFLAGAITLALVATLAFGVSYVRSAKAEGAVPVKSWTFEQGGQYNAGEPGNEGYIGNVTMNGTGDTITGWTTGAGSKEQTQTYNKTSNGFAIKIDNTGWDAQWKETTGKEYTTINPWSIQAWASSDMEQGHVMKVTFKARATSAKNCYVAFETKLDDGATMPPYDQAPMREGKNLVTFGTTDTEYTYIFDNFVNGENLKVDFMLGAFTADETNHRIYDYAMNDVTDQISEEVKWKGTVYISDFKIEDLGANPDIPTNPPKPSTTKAPTPTTAAPVAPKKLGKVSGVKVKSVKKKTIKVSWKKVKNAKKYQIKVGSKTYKASGTSKKIKNKKFKKGKKVTVKVRATATGYTSGAWSKAVKKKLTK